MMITERKKKKKNVLTQLMKSVFLFLPLSQSFGIKACALSSDEDSCSDSINEEHLNR